MKHHGSSRQMFRLVWRLVLLIGCIAYASASTAGLAAPTTAPARTRTPPGLTRKPATPTRKHIPPGLARKTGTPTPTPTVIPRWAGSVLINGGVCCVGGCVGQVVYLHVAFSASSPFGEVTEMRVKQGAPWFTNVDWEPFAPFKSYPWTIIANWAPLRINAQFRDQNGNLSPIYWDDIQQEGFCSITMTPSITRTPAVTSSFPIAPVLLYRGSLGWIH